MNDIKINYDWNLIKSFIHVFEAGSFSCAAKRSNISQPTLSRHIDELEKSLQMTLFERGRNGAMPTDSALKLADYARHIKIKADALSLFALGKSKELSGTVRITASEIVSTYLLPPIISKLSYEAPEIEVELVSTNKVENLTAREADIAIRMVRPTQLSLIAKKITSYKIGAFAHKDYLRNFGTPKTPSDLLEHRVLGYDRNETIIEGFAKAGVKIDRNFFKFRCDDQAVYWQTLCAGAGIGFAPNFLAQRESQLVQILPDIAIPDMPVWLVSHQEVRTNAKVRMVYDFLSKNLPAQ